MSISARDVVASPPQPTPDDFRRIATRDKLACRMLFDGWESPIRTIVSGYAPRPSDLDDLMQAGRIALFRAAEKYDPSREIPFNHYANRAIRNAAVKEARRLTGQRELEEVDLEALHAVATRSTPNEARHEQEESFGDWVAQLPDRLALTFRLLYEERLSQREAARIARVSQPYVAKLNKALLDHARTTLIAN